ncbi:hypothetical protein V6N13_020005 [Hibiscus sabdariffa]|uniref:Myb/SANT-like domain-containing protein n=1 Tax=Hibiscus sabdariffa TaxID=183260 RepID=A0ABR2ES85_9ROSI
MHGGNRLGHTFNKQAWTDMLSIFEAKFGRRNTLKSHHTNLWKQYNDVKNLVEQNWFSRDDTRKLGQQDAKVYRNGRPSGEDASCNGHGDQISVAKIICICINSTTLTTMVDEVKRRMTPVAVRQGDVFGDLQPLAAEFEIPDQRKTASLKKRCKNLSKRVLIMKINMIAQLKAYLTLFRPYQAGMVKRLPTSKKARLFAPMDVP